MDFCQSMVYETNSIFTYPGDLRLIFPEKPENSIRIRKTHLDWYIPYQLILTYSIQDLFPFGKFIG
ncbi:hypothetical protein NT017_03030 [Prolixibacter sp. NT017]|nr:hypothetical protein NT017_03030 [Prolixibacter sp. NT017]